MPCPGPGDAEYDPPSPPARAARVLWVGRICEHKRPDRLLEVARACPDIHFDVVGPAEDSAYGRRVIDDAEDVANVHLRGPAKRECPGPPC